MSWYIYAFILLVAAVGVLSYMALHQEASYDAGHKETVEGHDDKDIIGEVFEEQQPIHNTVTFVKRRKTSPTARKSKGSKKTGSRKKS